MQQFFRYYFYPFFLFTIFSACKQKPLDLSGNTPLKTDQIVAQFSPLNLPYNRTAIELDTLKTSIFFGFKAFKTFVPDSVFTKIIDTQKSNLIKILPIGKIEKSTVTYLIVGLKKSTKVDIVALALNEKNQFLQYKLLLNNHAQSKYLYSLQINKEPTFFIKQEYKTPNNETKFSKTGWFYMAATNQFGEVINESTEDIQRTNIITNPIENQPQKFKWSGDYKADSRNFIAIRDGKQKEQYLFYIHFEHTATNCLGDLKGLIKMKTNSTGDFSSATDPCVIHFRFDNNEISFEEEGNCGNFRGIECLFNKRFKKAKNAPKNK